MGKNNGLIITVIVVLSILVGLLGGYVLSDTLTDKNQGPSDNNINRDDVNKQPDNSQNNNEGTSNEDNKIEETNFTLDDAKKLMDKYKLSGLCGEYYIDNLSNSAVIKELAIKKSSTAGSLSHSEVMKTEVKDYVYHDTTKSFSYYLYNDVLTSAKELFGPNVILVKENDFSNCDSTWFYLKEYDKFVQLELGCGGDCMNSTKNLSVLDFEISGDVLYIYTIREMNSNPNSTNEKNKYTFKKQTGGYYMTAVEEIK